jgi:peptidoglycan LD-endopeptidase CwlK
MNKHFLEVLKALLSWVGLLWGKLKIRENIPPKLSELEVIEERKEPIVLEEIQVETLVESVAKDELWDNRELGASEEYVKVSTQGTEQRLEALENKIKELEIKPVQTPLEEQTSMFKFSANSLKRLETCHPDLQKLMKESLKVSIIDFGISTGVRSQKEQDEAFRTGKSKLQFPRSMHNLDPNRNPQYALAVDVFAHVPSEGGVTWKIQYYYYLFGVFSAVAKQLNIPIRHGLDFNMNGNFSDDGFLDGPHVELLKW